MRAYKPVGIFDRTGAGLNVERGRLVLEVFLSVIIPTYNCEKYIEECINSIAEQLPAYCELIAVDDGSSDNTGTVLAKLQNRYQNLKIIYKSHNGPSAARNAGLEAASGRWITFVDCDDMMHKDFLKKAVSLLEHDSDCYIFGIERCLITGQKELWTVEDHAYADISSFADDYIRKRNLLIYSACNKIYKRELILENGLRFDEGCSFGEDRLFNFAYLKACKNVTTSSLVMLDYLQRSTDSLSTRHIPRFFENDIALHEAKTACFLSLSKKTSAEERTAFVAYSLSREVENTVDRFSDHPEEIEENLSLINQLIFGGPWDQNIPVNLILVLGSSNCGYKVEKALELGRTNPYVRYIVSGGNLHMNKAQTEAEFMASYLIENGVAKARILIENHATCTRENLENSLAIIQNLQKDYQKPVRIGIVTAGFHILRTKWLVESIEPYRHFPHHCFPAYSTNMHPDNWFRDPIAKKIILAEFRKNLITTSREYNS